MRLHCPSDSTAFTVLPSICFQVEKLFVFDIHGEIKRFLQSLPVETSSYLLPVIAHYTGLFIEDIHICKHMSEWYVPYLLANVLQNKPNTCEHFIYLDKVLFNH